MLSLSFSFSQGPRGLQHSLELARAVEGDDARTIVAAPQVAALDKNGGDG